MRSFLKLTVFFLLTGPLSLPAQQSVRLSSPDGSIRFAFRCTDSLPVYEVFFKEKNIVYPSPLSLDFAEGSSFGRNIKMLTPVFREGADRYELVTGKTKSVNDRYREVKIALKEQTGAGREVDLRVRVYNDGLAFRYELPEQGNRRSWTLMEENTTFNLAGDPKVLGMFLPDFTTSHEGRYSDLPLSRIKEDTLMDMPALFTFPDSVYLAITEAALIDYAGMYLARHGNMLRSRLSPLPGQHGIKVKARLPHHSPWRVMMIGKEPGTLIASNILTDLSPACRIKDVSWIRPGKTDFHWWNGDVVPDTTFAPGINFETNQYYIDFCAENGIPYHTVIGYGGIAWYQNDGISYQPGPHSDVTRPLPGLDMQRICDYARKKGVGIRVWVHWKALYPQLEQAFTQFEKWGIKGMMVDFMNRDDQEMVNIQLEILESAARHHLHIQFHGAYKPTGLSRTYPNEFTREGTLNYENDKWGNPITPDDDLNIAFTRLLAGSTDYHLGGFHAVTPEKYKARYTRPLVLGTRCHMLAMYVILENPLGMVCDYPDAYLGQPGFDFLKVVPTVWDETRVPLAEPGKWLTIARRKGRDWFVGSITSSSGRNVSLPLTFLPPGHYQALIWSDAPDAATHPNHLVKTERSVQPSDILQLQLAPGGGQVIHLRRTD
ncbi:glycoside hydrolase family 97 protein [Compostibacter hankyongensis]|uniref:Glycoside hydrolase family 97 protein n=1 Tax=Compostibacter hankyongensis TaxID=1007089 RepID=A0ABP8G9S6_9BACT